MMRRWGGFSKFVFACGLMKVAAILSSAPGRGLVDAVEVDLARGLEEDEGRRWGLSLEVLAALRAALACERMGLNISRGRKEQLECWQFSCG